MNENRLIINQVSGANIVEYELDLFDSVPIPIVKSINDIENIAERKSDFSKTITLPGTQNNNDIFSNIFNLNRSVVNTQTYNFAPDFNPSLKADAILYKNGVVILQGYLQLVNINVVDDYEIEYEIIIIGRTANLFQDLGERKLNELDLSAYNHIWNRTNIEASWSGTSALGYYYGLIDYGIDSSEVNWTISNYLPQIYLKAIIDKIFSENGYSYSSAFFDSTRFKKLVIPANGKGLLLSNTNISDEQFKANRITNSTLSTFTNTYITLPFNNVVFNTIPTPSYDNTTYKFTNLIARIYTFETLINIDLKNTSVINQSFNVVANVTLNGFQTTGIVLHSGGINAGATINVSKILRNINLFTNLSTEVTITILCSTSNFASLQWSLKTDSYFLNKTVPKIVEGGTMDDH